MNKELKRHIKKLQNRAFLSLFTTLLIIISVVFGIVFLFAPSLVAIIFFAIAIIGVIYLICVSRIVKKETKETVFKPVIFHADRNVSFEELVDVLENLTDKENQLHTSEDIRFFRFKKHYRLRTVLYRTTDFNKKEFDAAKNRINKKANRELNISQWVNSTEAAKMMRLNIIYTDTLNGALYQLISQNANHNLTRVEGIINIAVVGNQILLPPLYGECDLKQVSRYKGMIQFINQVILNK